MKKVICLVTLILAFLAPQAVSYAQPQPGTLYIPSWTIQHRIYESGLEFYRIQFYVRIDDGDLFPNNDPYSDVDNITKLTLQTPEATYEFQRDYVGEDYLVNLYKDHTYFVQYDGNTGHFNYSVDSQGDLIESYEPLWCLSIFNLDAYSFPLGPYVLSVKFDNEETIELYPLQRSDIVPLPVIDSRTITADCTPQGIWFRWEAPYETFDNVDTSTRPAINLFEEGSSITTTVAIGYNLYTRIPFHMGGLFIPNDIVEQLEEKTFALSGKNTADFFQQTRTNDNSERRYSNHVLFSFVDCKIFEAPVIDSITFNQCISELCTSAISVSAQDPEGGNLTYNWQTLNGGVISGSGPDVNFDPPSSGPHPCPYQVEVTVTSDAIGLSTSQTIDIYVKLAGNVNGDGNVNVVDKVLVRNSFGQSGDPGWIDEDVNCDGYVNVVDKVLVRNQFGETSCGCP